MNLRGKVLLILSAVFICSFVVVVAFSLSFFTDRFLEIEQQQAQHDIERAVQALDNDITDLDRFATDWAWWDDTYVFSQDLNPGYITNNLDVSVFKNIRISYFLIIGNNGTVLYKKGVDHSYRQEIAVPGSFVSTLAPGHPLVNNSGSQSTTSGILLLPEGLVIVSSAPVLTSLYQGPSPAVMIMGRLLDDAEIARLSSLSGESIRIDRIDGSSENGGSPFIRSGPRGIPAISIDRTDPRILSATGSLSDTDGRPALSIGIRVPRDTYQSGLILIRNYLVLIVVMMAFFAGVVVFLTDLFVLKRLNLLIDRVTAAGASPDEQPLPPMEGNDEFVRLDSVIAESRRRIRENEAQYRRIVETAHEGIWVLDKDFRTTYANERMAGMLGYSVSEMAGLPADRLVPPEGAADQQLHIRNQADGISKTYERTFVRKDGSTIIALVSVTPVFKGSEFAGSVHVAHDITERLRAQQAILAANRKLNILSSITRHDILNKITALYVYLDISRDLCNDPAQRGHIDKEIETVQALQRQVEFTKYYQDIGVRAAEWQDIEAVFKNAVSQIDLKGISVLAETRGYQIFADPLIEKVFYNMVENSLRHGRHVTTIRLTAQETGGALAVVYEDNGEGIPADIKRKLFQRGFGKHTGLGLFLSREILAITGIQITENGEPGKGARFGITVPAGAFRRQ